MAAAPTASKPRAPALAGQPAGGHTARRRAEGTAEHLTYWEAGFYDDGLGDLPEAVVLVPAGLTPYLLQVAVVTVPADEGLHLLQELLEEHGVALLPADGGQVIDLLQLELRLQVFDLHLCCPELKARGREGGVVSGEQGRHGAMSPSAHLQHPRPAPLAAHLPSGR